MPNKKKRALTLEDLYNFCASQNKMYSFSSKDSGYQIAVQVPAKFEIDEDTKDDTLLFCNVKLMHSGENRNHSNVTDDALIKASKHLAYKPILANFMEYVDEETGETLKDFTSHDMEVTSEGTTYFEKQVGCFTADEPYFEIEEETGHNFLYGVCAIPREYTDTCSILERKNGTKISVELAVNAMEYDAAKRVLNLTDVVILGATLLGKNPNTLEDVGEGMLNARLDIADFSVENNSTQFSKDDKLIELLDKLNTTLSNFNNNTIRKEETRVEMNENFDEVTEAEKVTETEKTTEEEVTVTENESEETVDETSEEVTVEEIEKSVETETETEEVTETEETTDEPIVKEDEACGGGGSGSAKKKKKNSKDELFNELFEISFDEIRYALNALCSIYRNDSEWCYVSQVYEDYFIMEDWDSNKYYKQSYTKDGDNVSLSGERIEMFAMLLTESEKLSIEEMRSNYSSIVEQLNEYKSEKDFADKMTVFDDDAYADYLDTEEFKALMSKESVNQYSKEQLSEKADATLGKLVKKNKTFSYSEKTEKQPTVVFMSNSNSDKESKKKAPYGGIFDKYNK